MAITIDGKVYITTSEACKLLDFQPCYLFECIYRNNFLGIISIDDSGPMIDHLKSINVDPTPFISPPKKNNRFLLPISEVIAKKVVLDMKRSDNYVAKIRSSEDGQEIESKVAAERKFLKIPDLSAIMGVSEQTVRRWIKTGKMEAFVKPIKIGKTTLFERSKIQEFLKRERPEEIKEPERSTEVPNG